MSRLLLTERSGRCRVDGAVPRRTPMDRLPEAIEHLTVEAAGQTFHCATSGPADGLPVLLLHGFPELSYGWRHQIGALAAAGFRVIAPDQRGYGLTSKPQAVGAYDLAILASDVVALADAFGYDRLAIVGHDWGGIVAWRVASDFPDRVERLVILNAPNLDVVARHLVTHPLQLVKSFYVALFQAPYVPEWALRSADYSLLAEGLRATSNPGTFHDDELAVYKTAWAQPGALTAMLHWYRALPWGLPRAPVRIDVPTLILWGDRDSALDRSFAEECAALCDDVVVHHFPASTHWLHHEDPATVNARMLAFLASAE